MELEELKAMVLPNFYGYDKIKEALLVQLASDDIKMLITGDTAVGKTTILKNIWKINGSYRHYQQVIAGKEIICDNIVCVDDVTTTKTYEQAILLDLLDYNDRVLMVARSNTSRYDPYERVILQTGLPGNILNKFDMIFVMRDVPNKAKDEFVLDNIFNKKEDLRVMIVNHINRAKEIEPILDDSAQEEIKEYFLSMRRTIDETGFVAINYHIAETLTKLTKAYAKLLLKDVASKEEAKRAIELVHFMISLIGVDPETGKMDVSRITEAK